MQSPHLMRKGGVNHVGFLVPLCKPSNTANYGGLKGSISSRMKIGILMDAEFEVYGRRGGRGSAVTTNKELKRARVHTSQSCERSFCSNKDL